AGAADAPRTDARPGLRAGLGPVCDRNRATDLPPRPVAPRLLVLAGLGPLRPLAHGSVDGMGNADPPPHLRRALQPGLGRGDRPLLHPSAPRGRAVGAGAEAKLEAAAPRRPDDRCGVHGISSRVAGDPGPPRRAGLSRRDAIGGLSGTALRPLLALRRHPPRGLLAGPRLDLRTGRAGARSEERRVGQAGSYLPPEYDRP